MVWYLHGRALTQVSPGGDYVKSGAKWRSAVMRFCQKVMVYRKADNRDSGKLIEYILKHPESAESDIGRG